ncbi:PAS domain-containing protein [Sphingomonas sp. PWP1-2]|uniref:PAS domain-containing protein n=1 Tax=Sphingomonas sp. PWP1-2 TaxID=2804558 RepID=UPI003CEA0059
MDRQNRGPRETGLGPQQPKLQVTSAELVRQFGNLRHTMGDATVFVTNHGRTTHALLSAAQYEKLIANPQSGAGPDDNVLLPTLREFADWVPHGVVSLDTEMGVVMANRVAHAIFDKRDGELVGQNLYDAVPALKGSLAQTYINRAAAGKEVCVADLPSIFRPESWVRLEVYPLARTTTLMFRDITEEMQNHRFADAKRAIVDAITLHGGIGYMRLNVRGQIERVDASMCAMLRLPEDRLLHLGIADLVPVANRITFRERLEQVLRGDGPQRVQTVLLSNDGTPLTVTAAITDLPGIYGNEGAVVIVTCS